MRLTAWRIPSRTSDCFSAPLLTANAVSSKLTLFFTFRLLEDGRAVGQGFVGTDHIGGARVGGRTAQVDRAGRQDDRHVAPGGDRDACVGRDLQGGRLDSVQPEALAHGGRGDVSGAAEVGSGAARGGEGEFGVVRLSLHDGGDLRSENPQANNAGHSEHPGLAGERGQLLGRGSAHESGCHISSLYDVLPGFAMHDGMQGALIDSKLFLQLRECGTGSVKLSNLLDIPFRQLAFLTSTVVLVLGEARVTRGYMLPRFETNDRMDRTNGQSVLRAQLSNCCVLHVVLVTDLLHLSFRELRVSVSFSANQKDGSTCVIFGAF